MIRKQHVANFIFCLGCSQKPSAQAEQCDHSLASVYWYHMGDRADTGVYHTLKILGQVHEWNSGAYIWIRYLKSLLDGS